MRKGRLDWGQSMRLLAVDIGRCGANDCWEDILILQVVHDKASTFVVVVVPGFVVTLTHERMAM